jgi:hypothetical protein
VDEETLNRILRSNDFETAWPTHSLSEAASHLEHAAALEATVFDHRSRAAELVLELEAGTLRVRNRAG